MDIYNYLTPVEKKQLSLRKNIHKLLQSGHGVREISRMLKISSATVINTKRLLGFKLKAVQKQSKINKRKVPWKWG